MGITAAEARETMTANRPRVIAAANERRRRREEALRSSWRFAWATRRAEARIRRAAERGAGAVFLNINSVAIRDLLIEHLEVNGFQVTTDPTYTSAELRVFW